MYIGIDIPTHICTYTHMDDIVCIYVHTWTICAHIYTHNLMCIYMHIYIYTDISTHVHICAHISLEIYLRVVSSRLSRRYLGVAVDATELKLAFSHWWRITYTVKALVQL